MDGMSATNQGINALANRMWYQWRRNNWIVYPRRFAPHYADVTIDRPIFLLGEQGGGLTLVSRMLRRHPNVVSITGDSSYWSGADEMQKVMALRLPPSLRLGGRYLARDVGHPRFTPPRSWTYASDDLIGYYRNTAADYDPKIAATLRRIIGEALHRFGGCRPNLRFIDKSQVFTVKMGFVNALLQELHPHFVLVTRNPYAACYRAAQGKAGDMRRYATSISFEERLDICAQHWSNSMRAVLADRAETPHFACWRFEDILSNPVQHLREICEFVGLDYTDRLVPGAEDKIPFGSRYAGRWYPLRPDVNESYLNELSAHHVEIIARRCAELAEDFGYMRPHPAR